MAKIFDGGYYLYSPTKGYVNCVGDNSVVVCKFKNDVKLFFSYSNYPLKYYYGYIPYFESQPFLNYFLEPL